ncbi:HdeD family acid-resistance protein [Roseospira visakhapatnamensis]|uniref:Uncharacterized membrane protein HdeD (DUF308 family) n=1 Tax=Roseospira visakhapatnamensis TaxID=390880 RepID=A0A7W6RD80_9PROT|nr:HdeD family acid-resistance protein [Roseospira visakhapatnamensis]MBB4265874.1 uncharacterized membrane protein HdeD (DUF308 family) [Roseospira visakhapatnamensis]
MSSSITSTDEKKYPLPEQDPADIWGVDPSDLSRIGVVFVILGLVALLLPSFVTLTVEWLIGLTLLIAGGYEMTYALPFRGKRGAWWHLVLGTIVFLSGILFLASPLSGALTLTLIIGTMFIASGVVKTGFAIAVRRIRGWHLSLYSALITLAVGLVIVFLLPVVSAWLLGVLVGLEFLINGIWMLILSYRATRDSEIETI